MMRLLLISVICFVCVCAELPDEHSLATNYDATHKKQHTSKPAVPGAGSLATNYDARHKNEHGHTAARRQASHTEQQLNRIKRQACDSQAQFRSADGTCNNLDNPTWGSANQVFRRLIDPVYDDGKNNPRLKTAKGESLPSPRTVSTRVHDFDHQRLSPRATALAMEWGQFLAHDLTGTPVVSGNVTSDQCCNTSLVTSGQMHADVTSGGPCFPIMIEEGDRHFNATEDRCMEFVRSFPVTDDNGVRQQMSELSAYLDGTNVYGRNETEMERLRDTTGGKLRVTTDSNLPKSDDNYCIPDGATDYCLDAGDSRVNVYPPLGAMHTIFVRYHNYIAEKLAETHPDWTNDDLFYMARKIVIGVLQRITYSEYLPQVIGSSAMSKYGVSSSPYVYNSTCDATLFNVFATAAFRFGHSMVPDSLEIDGANVESINLFNRPRTVLHSLDSMVQGLVKNPSENVDRWYSLGMTDHLFEESPFGGLDIASLNIQRGRDHGLPPYNTWREFCGETAVTSFDQLPRHSVRRFGNVYGDPDDIDLYSGALTETGDGGLVGPTYACLLGKQFANLRNCDRFWWESTDSVIGFSTTQRRQIQRTKLSHVICLTTSVGSIQERVFRLPDQQRNAQQSCDNILANAMNVGLF